MERKEHQHKYTEYSDEWLISRYFTYGSVEDAINGRYMSVPFSFADVHRKLEKFGIVKSAGRHTNLSEALHFFRLKLMEPGTPLESLYKTMPPSFQTSIETLHRIYNRVLAAKQSAVPTRQATALVITNEGHPNQILVGTELFTEGRYGKVAGAQTIPMTFSKRSDTPSQRILRVLQQEVLTEEAIEKRFMDPSFVSPLLSQVEGPYLKYHLLDVEISCYALSLPQELSHFSSYKLSDHKYVDHRDIVGSSEHVFRVGVSDMVEQKFLLSDSNSTEKVMTSDFNISLATAEVPSLQSALRYSR